MKKEVLFRPTGTQVPPLTCIAVDPRGKRIACGTLDSQILLLDSSTGAIKRALKGHEAAISAVAFIDGGKGLVSCSWDCTTRRWTSTGPAKDIPFLRHGSEVKALAVGPEMTRGAAGSRDGEVKVFYTSSMKNYRNIQAHSNDISGLTFTQDRSALLTTSWDGECKLFDMSNFEQIRTIVKQKVRIRVIATDYDNSRVFLGLHDGTILSINMEDTNDCTEMKGHTDIVTSLAVDPTNRLLVSGSWDRSVRVWNIKTGKSKMQDRILTGVSAIGWKAKEFGFFTTDYSGALISWNISE